MEKKKRDIDKHYARMRIIVRKNKKDRLRRFR